MSNSLLKVQGLVNCRRQVDGGRPGVDLLLAGGEIVCVSGPSGAGKTLLLRAIADLDPSTGEVLLEGRPRASFSGSQWRGRVGYVAAESAWWNPRAGDYVGTDADQAADFALDAAVLNRQVAELSTGERQRLALWRAMRLRPRVLLLDEPTAALDGDAKRILERTVRRYLDEANAGALWVSHDYQQIDRLTQRHLAMTRDGRLLNAPAVAPAI